MDASYDQLRSAVLEYLRTKPSGTVGDSAYQNVVQICEQRGLQVEGVKSVSLVEEVFHELYLERVLVPCYGQSVGRHSEIGRMHWPKYRLTEYGRQVLSTTEYVPHDPEGYLQSLQSDVPGLDPAIVIYLEQALRCYKANLLLAAAVMTGCAAEKALLQLVEAFGEAISDPKDKSKYDKETRSWVVSRKFKALWKRLQAMQPTLPDDLGDDLEVNFERAFDLIRSTRNDAGHPTGRTPKRQRVMANFILFPIYCRQIYGLLRHFSQSNV